MELDKETNKQLAEGEELLQLVKGTGWGIVKHKLKERIIRLSDIYNIDSKLSAEEKEVRVEACKLALEELIGFLQDVEGDVLRHKSTMEIVNDLRSDTIFNIYE